MVWSCPCLIWLCDHYSQLRVRSTDKIERSPLQHDKFQEQSQFWPNHCRKKKALIRPNKLAKRKQKNPRVWFHMHHSWLGMTGQSWSTDKLSALGHLWSSNQLTAKARLNLVKKLVNSLTWTVKSLPIFIALFCFHPTILEPPCKEVGERPDAACKVKWRDLKQLQALDTFPRAWKRRNPTFDITNLIDFTTCSHNLWFSL